MWDWPKYLMACLLQIYPQNTILTSLPVTYGYGFQQLGGPAKSLKEFCFCVFGKFQPAEGLIFCLFKSSRTWERWDNLVLFTPLGALRNNKCKSAPPPPQQSSCYSDLQVFVIELSTWEGLNCGGCCMTLSHTGGELHTGCHDTTSD